MNRIRHSFRRKKCELSQQQLTTRTAVLIKNNCSNCCNAACCCCDPGLNVSYHVIHMYVCICRFPLHFVCFIFCFIFIFVLSLFLFVFLFCFCFLFLFFVFVFCFCFCFCLFRISLFQCISVADVCMLCLSYPVLGHDIALSNALRCIISVSWLVTTELIFLG